MHGTRREFLRIGLTGLTTLTLPGLLRCRAQEPSNRSSTAVLLVWLRGGCSHLDTYDPKPEAEAEFRGPFATIPTSVPGLRFSELLPRQARIADRLAVLRSVAHTGGGHPAGSLQMLSGDPDAQDKLKPALPDFMSVASHLRAGARRGLPNYVGVNPIARYDSFTIAGPAYLGPQYEPFAVQGDLNRPNFSVPNVGLANPHDSARYASRIELRQSLDRLRRLLNHEAPARALDEFESQAYSLLAGADAASAFDLSQEDAATRDRYGRNQWGQQLLMARRLVEAGVDIVTTMLDGSLCGRVANWDDHAVNHHVFDALKFRAPCFDQAVAALIEDIYQRGLDRRVLVVVAGDFGRTPRISYAASSGAGVASAPAGVSQPGRDHWPLANSILFAGGGIRTGQIIGATDARGEEVVERRVGPHDFLATIYRHLGIDYKTVALPDFSGRPRPIVTDGDAIPELARSS